MEEIEKNRARLDEIEREIADLKERRMALESQFENEKSVFNEIAQVKAKIEELKVQATNSERAGELSKVAEIRYGLSSRGEEVEGAEGRKVGAKEICQERGGGNFLS